MAEPVDPEKLTGREWTYVESNGDELIYAPAEQVVASRARGRIAMRFESDGRLVQAGPGPTDRPIQTEGTWEVQGDEIIMSTSGPAPTRRVLKVVSVDDDRLVLKA